MRYVDIDKVAADLDRERPDGWDAEDFADACQNAEFYSTMDDFMEEHGDEVEIMVFAPEPELTAEWIYGEGSNAHCSRCGHGVPSEDVSPFCPNCGSNMDPDAEED